MATQLKKNDPAKAREYFADKMAFTTGPVELSQNLKNGNIAIIDVREPEDYKKAHIPGAINLPYVEIRAGGLLPPRDQRIVVYCSSETCPISQYAYEALDQLGYEEIYDMRAGLQGWKDAGLPTVFGADSTATSR